MPSQKVFWSDIASIPAHVCPSSLNDDLSMCFPESESGHVWDDTQNPITCAECGTGKSDIKFYFDPTSTTAENGYHIVIDGNTYYDHIGGHSAILPECIKPKNEITKAVYFENVPATSVPTEYLMNS